MEKVKRAKILVLVLGFLSLNGCFVADVQPQANSSLKGTNPLQFSESKPSPEETFIQINRAYYLFPQQCLLERMHGAQADSRLHGDQADSRLHGDQADSRLHGDQADSRLHGDQADSRLHGDQADSRLHGDQADSRLHGDLADSRLHGDLADSRLHGSQVNQFKCSKISSVNGVVVSGFTGSEEVVVNTGSQFGTYSWANGSLILKF